VKVAVIGPGFGARVVAPAFAAAGCDVVDVISARDRAGAHALVERDDVDLVSVHAPPFLHAEFVQHALDRRTPVLCDKPFAMSPAEGEALRDAARGVPNFLNFEFRCHPVRERLRALVTGGAVGPVEHVGWTHLSAGSRVPLRPHGWLFDRAQGGGWIGAWASHAVDTVRWVFGEVSEASGYPRTDIRERPDRDGRMQPCTAEDGLVAHLVLTNGVTVAIDSTFAAPATLPPRVVVTGADGVIEVIADAHITIRRADGTTEPVAVDRVEGDDRHEVPMHRFAARIVASLRDANADNELPSFADGVACDAVLARLRG
jgi:predicted dehydrogenase